MDEGEDDEISRFCLVAGCDAETASFLLEATGGDFQMALNTFFGGYDHERTDHLPFCHLS